MSTPGQLPTPLAYLLQALGYAAFFGVVGYFATSPAYEYLPPGQAVVKLSIQHAGQRKEACRERSAEELAKLAPNMRAASVCPRERAPVAVTVSMDGQPLFDVVAKPAGLANDGASTIYRRVAVPAGTHRFDARLVDSADGAGGFTMSRTIELAAGRVVVIDLDPKQGGFVFRQ
jgi:hypothetical protein